MIINLRSIQTGVRSIQSDRSISGEHLTDDIIISGLFKEYSCRQ